MATNTLHYQCFLLLSLLLCTTSTVLSRTLVQNPKTCLLDLSASTQRMHQILSFNPDNQQEEQSLKKSDSLLTLKLFSRDTLRGSPFKNFEELSLSRLARDSARVSYIYRKLNVAAKERNGSEFDQSEIEAPVTAGAQQGAGGEYLTRLGVGTPARQFYMTIDTGSDINWLQCAPCTQCYNQTDPLFEPSGSSSYRTLSCDSPTCGALNPQGCNSANTCAYYVTYGDSSFTRGDFATERLTFGSSVVDNVAIGCGRENNGIFSGSAGILGLGRSAVSLPTQLQMPSFSYCLVDRDSTAASTLDFSSITIPSNAITTPLLLNSRNPIFYYVGLTGISVGAQMLSISPSEFSISSDGSGGVIIDSGTTVSRFSVSVYNVFRDAFVSAVTELPRGESFGVYDTCFGLGSQTEVSVPTVAFHFGTESMTLPPHNYLRQVRPDLLCFAFATSPLQLSIIGNVQQQGIRVTFDVNRSLIGFTLDQC